MVAVSLLGAGIIAAVAVWVWPGGDAEVHAQVAPDDGEPFIGLVVSALGDEEALKLGVPGGVSIDRVLEDGPAAGVLEPGDVITFIDGVPIGGMADLHGWLHSAAAGQAVSLTVVRRGETHEIELTLGSRPENAAKSVRIDKHVFTGFSADPQLLGLLPVVLGKLKALEENFVRGELVFETESGFKTYTAIRGILSSIDVDGGTFTVTPRDGSGAVSYKVSDDTVVATLERGSLLGLNDGAEALVVAVNEEVKLVHVGELELGDLLNLPQAGSGLFPAVPVEANQLQSLFDIVQKRLKELEESSAASR